MPANEVFDFITSIQTKYTIDHAPVTVISIRANTNIWV